MIRHLLMLLVVAMIPFVLLMGARCQTASVSKAKYPNELASLKLYDESRWKAIVPYESTKEDVESLLGLAKPIIDKRFYVQTQNDYWAGYEIENGWILIVTYLAKGGAPENLIGRVSHITLYPSLDVEVRNTDIPETFKNYSLQDNGVRKCVYFDEFGLRYTFRLTAGPELILESVRYGASDERERNLPRDVH